MKRPKKNGAEEIDGHNQTTEAFDFGVSPYAPTVTGNRLPPDTPPIAMVRPSPPQPGAVQPPLIGAYPFLPPSPIRQNGSATPVGNIEPSQPQIGGTSPSDTQRLRKFFPALVGLCFVVVQLLLLVSFALNVVGLWNNTLWVNVLYVIRDILIWPLQALAHQLPAPFSIPAQIVVLLAILLYGMLSRVVVRCLKLLLHTRRV